MSNRDSRPARKAVVIIPTYNERENIKLVIPMLMEFFEKIKGWEMSILVVDDSSPDGTMDEVKKLQKKYSNLELLVNKRKAGLGGAYLKGMEMAYGKLKAEVAFEFDADLSHDHRIMPKMLRKIEEGYDLVLGSRYVKGGGIPDDWGFHRKFLSRVGNMVIATVFTNFSVRDWTAGYRAITKEVYEAVHHHLHSERFFGYTFQIGFLYTTIQKGFRVAEVPYKFVDRTIGHSKLGPEYLKNTLMYIFKVRIEELLKHRFIKFGIVGGIGALVQLIALSLLKNSMHFQLAFFLAIEFAILSNFLLNNIWTFSDRKLKLSEFPTKFVQFNLASAGSILIQQATAILAQLTVDVYLVWFTSPKIGPLPTISWTTGHSVAIVGILIGMFWNFFAYNKFIWKNKKKR